MRRETWYVMEDGTVGDPRLVSPGADGRLVHRDGRKVAYAPHGPRSRGVDVGAVKEMRPQQSGPAYLTREASHPLDHDGDGRLGGSAKPDDAGESIGTLRAEYYAKFGKRPFPGWDAATLRARMAAAGDDSAAPADTLV